MEKRLKEIKEKFKEEKYNQVVVLADSLLDHDATVEKLSMKECRKVFQYRTSALTHLGRFDQNLNTLIMLMKYPYVFEANITDINSSISLKYGNALTEKGDLLLNSITQQDNLSRSPKRSLSRHLYDLGIRLTSSETLSNGIIKTKARTGRWPTVYHFPFISSNSESYQIQWKLFRKFIKLGITEASHNKLHQVIIPPLGLETVDRHDDLKGKKEIVEVLVEEVLNTARSLANPQIEIKFLCNHLSSYNVFKEELQKACN